MSEDGCGKRKRAQTGLGVLQKLRRWQQKPVRRQGRKSHLEGFGLVAVVIVLRKSATSMGARLLPNVSAAQC